MATNIVRGVVLPIAKTDPLTGEVDLYVNNQLWQPDAIAGPQGPQGIKGNTGTTGPRGLQGIQGNPGLTGLTGPAGSGGYEYAVANGFTGTLAEWLLSLVGPIGPQGIQGTVGPQGATGPVGPQGPTGADSIVAGPQGPIGLQGAVGPAGPNGLTAYQSAVDSGFVGSEVQWLASLVGPTGPQGTTGLTGSQGLTGPQGIQGLTGNTGPQGIQGIQGITGSTGATGQSAYANAVASGFVGSESAWRTSLIGATGPQGPQGIQGIQGVTGATGPQGLSGTGTGDVLTANNLSDLTNVVTARTNLGLGTLATQSGTFSGSSSGTNTGDQTNITGNAGTATALSVGADRTKLDGIEAGATAYSHPVNHPASIITQDASNRFVTDVEKASWNAKQPAGTYATGTGSASGVNTGDQVIPTTLPASDVYAWAKEATKPTYTASEVGAIPTTDKAAPSGVATLDGTGLIPVGQAATGTADVTKFLRGDRVWAVPGAASGGGLGTLECYNSAGVRDDVPVVALSNIDALTVNSEIILGAACDIYQNTTGSFGWRDNIQSFSVKSGGATPPSYGTTIGNFEGYIWSATVMNQAMVDFHIDHDYALGTVLYPHVHFRPLTAGAGVVRWGFEVSASKGHGQQVGFPASTTVYVNFTVAASNLGTHYVAEVALANAISSLNIEPDSVIHIRVFRDAANAADTYAGTVWAWQADLHYQFARLGTLNRAPNFYG